MRRKIILPVLDRKIRISAILLSGSGQGVRYISENENVRAVGAYFPAGAAVWVDRIILDSIRNFNTVFINRIKAIAFDYKIPTYIRDPMIPFRRLENFGIGEIKGNKFEGSCTPTDQIRYLEENWSWVFSHPDGAVMSILFEFNQTPIPMREVIWNYCVEYLKRNGLQFSDEFLKSYSGAMGAISHSGKIKTYVIDGVSMISGPKLKTLEVAEKIVRNRHADLLALISESPWIVLSPNLDFTKLNDLRATGVVEFVFDPKFNVYYVAPAVFFKNLQRKFGDFLAEKIAIAVGRKRLGRPEEDVLEPIGDVWEYEEVRNAFEEQLQGILSSKYIFFLGSTDKTRREVVAKVARLKKRIRSLLEFMQPKRI